MSNSGEYLYWDKITKTYADKLREEKLKKET